MRTIKECAGRYTLVGKEAPKTFYYGPIPNDDVTTGRYCYTVFQRREAPGNVWCLILPGQIFINEMHATLRDAKAAAAAWDADLP